MSTKDGMSSREIAACEADQAEAESLANCCARSPMTNTTSGGVTMTNYDGGRMSLEGALIDAEQYRSNSTIINDVVCRHCVESLREAGQLTSCSVAGNPRFDFQACDQCGSYLIDGETYTVSAEL